MEIIRSSLSTVYSTVRSQVFEGAAEDCAGNLDQNAERVYSPKSSYAQTSEEDPTSAHANVGLIVASTKEPVGQALEGDEVELGLAAIDDLAAKKTTTPLSPLPVVRLLAAGSEMAVGLRIVRESPCGLSENGGV